jgi:hypothetical protein
MDSFYCMLPPRLAARPRVGTVPGTVSGSSSGSDLNMANIRSRRARFFLSFIGSKCPLGAPWPSPSYSSVKAHCISLIVAGPPLLGVTQRIPCVYLVR